MTTKKRTTRNRLSSRKSVKKVIKKKPKQKARFNATEALAFMKKHPRKILRNTEEDEAYRCNDGCLEGCYPEHENNLCFYGRNEEDFLEDKSLFFHNPNFKGKEKLPDVISDFGCNKKRVERLIKVLDARYARK